MHNVFILINVYVNTILLIHGKCSCAYVCVYILFAMIVIIYNVTLLPIGKNSYLSSISPVYPVWFQCIYAHLLTTFQLIHILFGQWFPWEEIWFHYPPFTSRMAFVWRCDDILSLAVMPPLGLLMYFLFKNYLEKSLWPKRRDVFPFSSYPNL